VSQRERERQRGREREGERGGGVHAEVPRESVERVKSSRTCSFDANSLRVRARARAREREREREREELPHLLHTRKMCKRETEGEGE
jgi:hypothetical protein